MLTGGSVRKMGGKLPIIIQSDTGERGNTIPYPPLYDDIRQNHGFIDLRGSEERVAEIPETRRSDALFNLLRLLAIRDFPIMSLGCDLGEHRAPKARSEARYVAGGYVQLAHAGLDTNDFSVVRSTALSIERALREGVGAERWWANFSLRGVHYDFTEPFDSVSLWLLFQAKALSPQKAIEARERLIRQIQVGLEAREV